jgi:hypothetical protein
MTLMIRSELRGRRYYSSWAWWEIPLDIASNRALGGLAALAVLLLASAVFVRLGRAQRTGRNADR